MKARVSLVACIVIGLTGCPWDNEQPRSPVISVTSSPTSSASFDANGITKLDFPENGAVLGQGIDVNSGIAADSVCILGKESPNDPIPQTLTVNIRDNSNASSFFQETGVSASAQVHALIGDATGKVKYVSSHKFSQASSTLSVHETVEQRRYIVPSEGLEPAENNKQIDVTVSKGIQLTPRAVYLLTHPDKPENMKAFMKECGDGFIAV
jgi:hypothetical protein